MVYCRLARPVTATVSAFILEEESTPINQEPNSEFVRILSGINPVSVIYSAYEWRVPTVIGWRSG